MHEIQQVQAFLDCSTTFTSTSIFCFESLFCLIQNIWRSCLMFGVWCYPHSSTSCFPPFLHSVKFDETHHHACLAWHGMIFTELFNTIHYVNVLTVLFLSSTKNHFSSSFPHIHCYSSTKAIIVLVFWLSRFKDNHNSFFVTGSKYTNSHSVESKVCVLCHNIKQTTMDSSHFQYNTMVSAGFVTLLLSTVLGYLLSRGSGEE